MSSTYIHVKTGALYPEIPRDFIKASFLEYARRPGEFFVNVDTFYDSVTFSAEPAILGEFIEQMYEDWLQFKAEHLEPTVRLSTDEFLMEPNDRVPAGVGAF